MIEKVSQNQFRAANRFGLGTSKTDLQAMGSDPLQWLLGQLKSTPASGPKVPASATSIATNGASLRARREAQRDANADADRIAALEDQQRDFRRHSRRILMRQSELRFDYAVKTAAPFRERLVHFYSNHFTVSRQGKPQLLGSCVAYENEAIRASLDGNFEDLLLRVVSHPAMLLYLDNAQSMGADSMIGRRRNMGLNENLAREILELHTLGVDAGYTQNDVSALAAMLTGWTVGSERLRRLHAEPGEFVFASPMHAQGQFRLLGKRYAAGGVEQGREALKDLARHPATARFVSTKLVRHFVADHPPARAVDELTQVFIASEGHLPTVHEALVNLPECWDLETRKLKTPHEFLVSVFRGLDLSAPRAEVVLGPLRLMNHFPFTAPSPAGWPDEAAHWGASLKQRIEWAVAFGQRMGTSVDVREAAQRLAPPDAATALKVSIRRAESSAQGLGLLLASPDFQWR